MSHFSQMLKIKHLYYKIGLLTSKVSRVGREEILKEGENENERAPHIKRWHLASPAMQEICKRNNI